MLTQKTLYIYSSPLNLAGFYPLEFEIDMEGKKFDWEAVALIPFIGVTRGGGRVCVCVCV
jgi:5'-3' exonuclease